MSIEIRQLVIKSNVSSVAYEDSGDGVRLTAQQLEAIKRDVLAECKRLLVNAAQERGDR